MWPADRDNLPYVLDDIESLLKNLDSERIVITSDHGNGFGGFWICGHPPSVPHPVLKRVPGVELTVTDARTYEPDYEPPAVDVSEEEVPERLEALGYKELAVQPAMVVLQEHHLLLEHGHRGADGRSSGRSGCYPEGGFLRRP